MRCVSAAALDRLRCGRYCEPMYDLNTDLLDAYYKLPDILSALVSGHSDAELRTARGGDENWSVIEVVCHLRDAEERALERMRAMRDEEHPFLASYDQAAWAMARNYAQSSMSDALAGFLTLRKAHWDALAALSPEQWQRTGQHAEQGQITIFGHTLHMVSHDMVHAAQIARQLQSPH